MTLTGPLPSPPNVENSTLDHIIFRDTIASKKVSQYTSVTDQNKVGFNIFGQIFSFRKSHSPLWLYELFY